VDEFDSNIGYCYLDSAALPIAASVRDLLDGSHKTTTLCHIVPQNRGYVQQQAALLFEILYAKSKNCEKQLFVIHGGTDSKDFTLSGYERDIDEYVRSSLKQRLHVDAEQTDIKLNIRKLTESKIKFDLLSCRQTARLKIPARDKGSFDGGKGGIFVQYTCARLAVLLRNYDRCVEEGKYSTPVVAKLTLDQLNLGCLFLEQDWLLWRICYRTAAVLERAATLPLSGELNAKADMLAHSVCEMLMSLCVEFSTYYSKVRILVENQPHLLEGLQARVYLLKAVQALLHRGLSMLALCPVERM